MKQLMLILICGWYLGASADDRLDKARALYLNKDVTIVDTVFYPAIERDGRFHVPDGGPWLANSYKGQTATVIAIQPKQSNSATTSKVNALGESIEPMDTSGEVEFVIRFKDGTVALRKDSLQGIKQWMLLPEDISAKQARVQANELKAQQLVGKAVYATALSKVYRPDSSLTEMDENNRIPVPSFVPLQVMAAKWNQGMGCAIIKIAIPGGGSGITLISPDANGDCGSASMLLEIPFFLSPRDIDAVRRHDLVRGMSGLAVFYSMGAPEHENDWGRGGKQMVYKSGLFVYTNEDDKVVDWQKIDSGQ